MKSISLFFKNQRGFTLVEILSVTVIIGILLIGLSPKLNSFTKNSQVGVVETDIRLLKSNIQEHFIDNPSQPLTKDLLQKYFGTEVTQKTGAGVDPAYYILPEKKDPWGMPYEIIVGKNELFVAFHSYGADTLSNISSGVTATNLGDDVLALFYPQT